MSFTKQMRFSDLYKKQTVCSLTEKYTEKYLWGKFGNQIYLSYSQT